MVTSESFNNESRSTMDFLYTAKAGTPAARVFFETLFPEARERRQRAEYEAHMKEQRERGE